MAKIAGLDVRCVSGISKGAGYTVGDVLSADKTDHEWNIVVLDGDVYHLDATWSAGSCNGLEFTREWNEHYFLTPAEMFVLDHFPQDIQDQYISPPISLVEFINLPEIRSNFFRAKMVPISSSASKGVIDCDGQAEVELRFNIAESWTFHQPELRPKRKGGLSKKLPDSVNVLWISKNQIKVICRVPSEKGEYVLRMFTCPQSSDEFGLWAADYLLRVNRPPLQKPDSFPFLYSTHHLKVLEPMNAKLSVGTKVRFRHQFIASEKPQDHQIVVILPGNDWVYLKSKPEGDGSILFEDEISIKKAGEVKISIQRSGEESAHTVAKYKAV